MGFEDPEPLVALIADHLSTLRSMLVKEFEYTSPQFASGFADRVRSVLAALEQLEIDIVSNSQANQIATSDSFQPAIDGSALGEEWFDIRGIPVWTVDPKPALAERLSSRDLFPRDEVEVVVYLDSYSDNELEEVQNAAISLASSFGYHDFGITDEQFGSIFRSWKAKLSSAYVYSRLDEIDQRVSLELVGKSQAENDAIRTVSAVSLIASLAEIPNAVVRVGGLLIIKQTDPHGSPFMLVRQLNQKEIRAIEKNPGIQRNPSHTLELLATAVAQLDEGPDVELN